MNKSIPLIAFLLALSFSAFAISDVSAQETVSLTTSISPITILFDEFIPLLDTSTTGNLTSVSVTANLPCNSSNTPLLTIVVGILGDTVNLLDSSSDFIGNGPRDTCVFRDNITNVTAANLPAINSVFLNHTGSSPVHIPQGVMVTLSGVFTNSTSTSESTLQPTSLVYDEKDETYFTVLSICGSGCTGQSGGNRVTSGSDLIGTSLQYFTLQLRSTGSPSGDMSSYVWDGDGTVIATGDVRNANILSGTADDYEFNLGEIVTLQEDYTIGITYTGANGVWLDIGDTDTANIATWEESGGWSVYVTQEINMSFDLNPIS